MPTSPWATRITRAATIGLPLVMAAVFAAACGSSGGGAGSGGSSGAAGAAATAGSNPATAPTSAAAPASAAATGGSTIKLTGGHLVDGAGRTVYLWLADTGGRSTCTSACAAEWPPVPASGSPNAGSGVTAAELTTVPRADGTTQLAYDGHPLYYFTGDTGPGTANGQGSDGFGAKWWEIDGSGHPITATSGGRSSKRSSHSSSAPSAGSGGYGY